MDDRPRSVLVTGASRGLGREIALAFGRSRCAVLVNYLERHRSASEVGREIEEAGGRAVLVKGDVRKAADAGRMVAEAVDRAGSLDVVINNAGIARDGLLLKMQEEDWDDVIATNISGAFHIVRAAADIMIKQGGGHIVNIASITAVQGREGQANYSSSKAALIGLTKAAAKEFGAFNIRVNAVLPGFLRTDMGKTVSRAIIDRVLRENALHRLSEPAEVAEFIHHLASTGNISGQVFNLDSRVI